MNIYYDENMPYAAEFFGEFGKLHAFSGRDLSASSLIDADVLLVRSITKVNESLLTNSPKLKFVGTATIGVDHIDQPYLNNRDIEFTSAPGCNAVSVAEYVLSSLIILAERYQFSVFDKTVGIVGAGNTGTRLSEKLDALGIRYKLHDPLLAHSSGESRSFVSLDEIMACDVISLHVPKTKTGDHPTFHLFDKQRLSQLREDQILINACRGEVIDNKALLAMKREGAKTKLVLDVWEDEPNILMPLIPFCEITTAHIAGYSLEGKARGTQMLYLALCKLLKKSPSKTISDFLPKASVKSIEVQQKFDEVLLNQLVKIVYDVRRDDGIFRQQLSTHGFDYIRKTYPARREFSATKINMSESLGEHQVYQLGFGQE